MTSRTLLERGPALVACVLALMANPVPAQNGSNWHVMSNGVDVVYLGLGAGGTQVAGVDGIGNWVDGNDLRGNHVTGLGDFGYRQVAFFASACVLGPAPAIALDFPATCFIEFGGQNNSTDVFVRPTCIGGVPTGSTSIGVLPYGLSPGASASFLLAGLPTGSGLPSSTTILLPNEGLIPVSNGGTATLIGALTATLPIASTGLCWAVRFDWAPSALVSVDNVAGWWFWQANSVNGNQYWSISNDEGNSFTSNTLVTDAGQTALLAFFASTELEWHQLTRDPSMNQCIAPTGFNGSGPYYATTSFGPVGTFNPNGGGDLGRHSGISIGGTGGSLNPNTGLGTQDPAGAAITGLIPTFGYVSWDNDTTLGGGANSRTMFSQVDWGGVFGTDPATLPDAIVGPPGQRLPVSVVNPPGPGPWPQSVTVALLLPTFHDPSTKTDPDPLGFPAGSFNVPPVWAASPQLATTGLSPVCSLGVPVPIDYGSVGVCSGCDTQFFGGLGFNFDPGSQRISHGGSVHVVD